MERRQRGVKEFMDFGGHITFLSFNVVFLKFKKIKK